MISQVFEFKMEGDDDRNLQNQGLAFMFLRKEEGMIPCTVACQPEYDTSE